MPEHCQHRKADGLYCKHSVKRGKFCWQHKKSHKQQKAGGPTAEMTLQCPPCPPCAGQTKKSAQVFKAFQSLIDAAPEILTSGANLATTVKNIKKPMA